MTVNALVVGRLDQPADPWAGVWIAEDIQLIDQGVQNGSWIDGTLGVAGAGLDGLALVSDPIGTLLQYGVSWLMEHVRPLTEALNWLAGDPGQIAGNAQTWRNTAAALFTQAEELSTAVRRDVADWAGAASAAYRGWTGQQQAAITALGQAADTMASLTDGAAALIAAVRGLVRDLISACVSRLITYVGEAVFSLGSLTPLIVEQVTATVAAFAAKIARTLRSLLSSLRNLIPIVRRLGSLIDHLKKLLGRLRSQGGGSRGPGGSKSPKSKYHAMSPDDLVADRGANVGRPGSGGKSRDVREVATEQDLREYFDALTAGGGTDVTPPGFSGTMLRLSDGTIVTWRTKSKTTGSVPTVDVNPGKGLDFRVHVNPHGW